MKRSKKKRESNRGDQPEAAQLLSKFKPGDSVWFIHQFYKQTKCAHCERHNDIKQVELVKAVVSWVHARWHMTWGCSVVNYRVKIIRRSHWSKDDYMASHYELSQNEAKLRKVFEQIKKKVDLANASILGVHRPKTAQLQAIGRGLRKAVAGISGKVRR